MFSVTKSSLPAFLHTSKLYQALEDDNDNIEFPARFCKFDESIESVDDLVLFVSTIHYWMVPGVPFALLDSAFNNAKVDNSYCWENLLAEFGKELPYLKDLANIRTLPFDLRVKAAVESGWFDIVEFLYCQNYSVPKNVCAIAAGAGHLKSLQYFHNRGSSLPRDCGMLASAVGSIDCLEYLDSVGFEFDGREGVVAAEFHHMDCLTFCCRKRLITSYAYTMAAKNGHLDCLQVLFQSYVPCPEAAVNIAAQKDNLACLKLLEAHLSVQQLSLAVILGAMRAPSLHCFAYLCGRRETDYFPLITKCCASEGRLSALQCAHELGCPWDAHTITAAAERNHIDCLIYAHEHGCPWNESACRASAHENSLACLQYLVEHGCPFGSKTCAVVRDLPTMTYLYEHGCEWSYLVSINAVGSNNLELLKYVTERGCPWSRPGGYSVSTAWAGHPVSDEMQEYIKQHTNSVL